MCFGADAQSAWDLRRLPVASIIGESHFSIHLFRCPHCGQDFVSVFAETIDWADSEDPQDWDLLPLTRQEAEGVAREGAALDLAFLQALGQYQRRLKVDYPKGEEKRVSWAEGAFYIRAHD